MHHHAGAVWQGDLKKEINYRSSHRESCKSIQSSLLKETKMASNTIRAMLKRKQFIAAPGFPSGLGQAR